MEFENGFSIILIVTSVVMFLVGWNYLKNPPKYSEAYKGWTKSKYEGRSKAHWVFSHTYGGKLYLKLAFILFGLGAIGLFINFGFKIGFILAIVVICVGVTIIRIKIENALIDKFGK